MANLRALLNQERIASERARISSEKRLKPTFRRCQAEAIKPILDWISMHGVKGVPVDALIITGTWRQAYINAYKMVGMTQAKRQFRYQRFIERGLDEVKATEISFLTDQWTRILRAYAIEYSELLGYDLDRTTIDIIKKALGKEHILALDPTDKKTIRIIRKDLADSFNFRTDRLARTESTTISALGNELGARTWIREQGGQGYRAWFGMIERERQTHLDTNDTIIKLDDKYIVGGEYCSRPGDVVLSKKERINCRCSETFMSENRYNQYVKRGMIIGNKIVNNIL